MPVIKSAIKKLRQDKKRTAANKKIKQEFLSAIKGATKTKKTSINEAFSKIDKAAKKGIIHANKAGRLKSRLSKTVSKKLQTKKIKPKKMAVKKTKKTSKKSSK